MDGRNKLAGRQDDIDVAAFDDDERIVKVVARVDGRSD